MAQCVSRENLYDLYINQRLSESQIGLKVRRSRSRINQLLKKHGIHSRGYAEASSNMNNQRTKTFSHEQEQLILGSMLGDANLHRWTMVSNKKCKSILHGFRLTFAHCVDQLDYLLIKKSVIGGTKIGQRISGHGSTIKHFSFCHSPTLKKYSDICLDPLTYQKSVNQQWLDQIDWLGIAYWFMDDGSLIIHKNRPRLEFHTESFTTQERELLRKMLLERFDLTTSLRKCNNDPKQQKIVSKHKHEVTPFLDKIRDYIVPASMQHKKRW